VIGWVRRGLQIASELATSERGVQRLAGFEACSSGDGGFVDQSRVIAWVRTSAAVSPSLVAT
jgi:hypothetical protein